MKKPIYFILTLSILFSAFSSICTFVGKAATSDVTIIVENSTGTVYIRGLMEQNEDKYAQMFILKPGKTSADLKNNNSIADVILFTDELELSDQNTFYYQLKLNILDISNGNTLYIKSGDYTIERSFANALRYEGSMGNGVVIEDKIDGITELATANIYLLKSGLSLNDLENISNCGQYILKSQAVNIDREGNFKCVIDSNDVNVLSQIYIRCADKTLFRNVSMNEFFTEYHVANGGGFAEADGSKANPYGSIDCAKTRIKNKLAAGSEFSYVVTVDDDFQLNDTALIFTTDDSAVDGANIVYRAANGKNVVFSGSKAIDISKFTKVSDLSVWNRLPVESRDQVLEASLAQFGITKNMVDMTSNLSVGSNGSILGVYLNGKDQTLARWPNRGFAEIGTVLNKGGSYSAYTFDGDTTQREDDKAVFEFSEDNTLRWTTATDAYIKGYLAYDWYSEWAKLYFVDIQNKTISLDKWTEYGVTEGQRFGVINLLEELDMQGEWYIDKDSMKMYYYPPYELGKNDTLEVACNDNAFLTFSAGAKNIWIDGFKFEETKGNGVCITNCDNIKVTNCTFNNIQQNGIYLYGKNNLIEGCDILNIGCTAIWNEGGADMATYTKSGNRIANNHIYDFALSGNSNSSMAIRLATFNKSPTVVGDIVENNIIHGNFDGGCITYMGNDNQIRYNEIYNVLRNSSDSGVIYAGARFNTYGNKISYNYIHDFGSAFESVNANSGIYWDDFESGQTAENNIIVPNSKINKRANMSTGRDNVFKYNTIVNSDIGVYLGDRTESGRTYPQRAYATFTETRTTVALLAQYPAITANKTDIDTNYANGILDTNGNGKFIAKNNIFTDNVNVDVNFIRHPNNLQSGTEFDRNMIINDYSIFVDAANQDYRLKMTTVTANSLSSNLLNENNFSMDEIGIQQEINATNDSFKLLYPKNAQKNVSSNSYILWEKAMFADQYEYVVATSSDFSTGSIVIEGTTYDTYVELNNLQAGQTYYWKVTAKNISKQIGSTWDSEIREQSFTVSNYSIQVVSSTVKAMETPTEIANYQALCTLKNVTNNSLKFDLIVALKDSFGKVVNVNMKNGQLLSNEEDTFTVDLNLNSNYKNEYYLELYIWDSKTGMRPLTQKIYF